MEELDRHVQAALRTLPASDASATTITPSVLFLEDSSVELALDRVRHLTLLPKRVTDVLLIEKGDCSFMQALWACGTAFLSCQAVGLLTPVCVYFLLTLKLYPF